MVQCTECRGQIPVTVQLMPGGYRTGKIACGSCGAEYQIIITKVKGKSKWHLGGKLVTEEEYNNAHSTKSKSK